MTELASRLPWLGPAILLLALALALVPSTDILRLAGSATPAAGVVDALSELPPEPVVLVGFDPDLGTYAEVRPTVRSLLADLLERDARLVFVSMTPEGRALAIAERARLVAGGFAPERLADAGFIPGGEAALVRLAGTIAGGAAELATELPVEPIALAVVVGGNDLGPRSWVEQVAPRVDGLELIAVAPSVLLPELRPYLESGQLRALLATPREGAAYRDASGAAGVPDERGPSPIAVLVGLLVAIGVLGVATVARLGDVLQSTREREPA